MDNRINRFKLCDLRFYPYLRRIIERLPEEAREDVLSKRKTGLRSKDVDDLLLQWGFRKEVEAVRYDHAISESNGYKIGYDWAKEHNHDYLMQHFGLYFDQWNDDGMGRLSNKELNMLNRKFEAELTPEDIVALKRLEIVESDNGRISESLSNRMAMLAGILTAVKEANIQ